MSERIDLSLASDAELQILKLLTFIFDMLYDNGYELYGEHKQYLEDLKKELSNDK